MCSVQFTFEPGVSLDEAEMSLHLALFAVEGIAGSSRVRLDARYEIDHTENTIRVIGRRRVCRLISRAFAALLVREFGEEAFRVERPDSAQLEEVAA